MLIVLPQEATNRPTEFYHFAHPRTGERAEFLVDLAEDAPHAIYELTAVGSDMSSTLIGNDMQEKGEIVVATALHPLFLVIPTLYSHRNKAFPPDIILELAGTVEGCQEIPSAIVLPHLPKICDCGDGKFVLNMEKLKNFLDLRAARVQAGLPLSVRNQLMKCVSFDESNADIRSELEQYGAVSMLATSWLPEELAEWFLGTFNFSALTAQTQMLEEQHRVMDFMQEESRAVRGNGAGKKHNIEAPKARKPKQQKVLTAKNNQSILDMFKKR